MLVSKLDLQGRARENALRATRELQARRIEHEAVARFVAAQEVRVAAAAGAQRRERLG